MTKSDRREPDWRSLVRARLSALNLSSEQEDKVLEELAQLLSDASRDADLDLDSPTAVESWLEEQIPEWQDLGELVRSGRRPGPAAGPLPLFAPPSVAPSSLESRSAAARLRFTLDAAFSYLRYGLRRLLQKPGFTTTAVLSLAIGIGANAAIFSVVNALLIRDVPLKDPARLVNAYFSTPDFEYSTFSHPDYADFVAGSTEFFVGALSSQIVIGQTLATPLGPIA